MTGQNVLSDLRDMIQCQSDLALCQDHSEGPRNVNPADFSKVGQTRAEFLGFEINNKTHGTYLNS